MIGKEQVSSTKYSNPNDFLGAALAEVAKDREVKEHWGTQLSLVTKVRLHGFISY